MSKISLKHIPIHIHNFEHSRVIMNIKLSSHGFLFHRNINRRENKAQIPLIIHHNEKSQRIYFWCAEKDNWASQISDVGLRKELEPWKFIFPPPGQSFRISNQQKMLRKIACLRTCVYIVLMHGEKESLSGQRLSKDHSWRIAENSWVSGSENLKKMIKQHLHHHMLFGRVEKLS